MSISLALTAMMFGLISAVSMPLGSLTLKVYAPKDKFVAFMLAFGSGALLAALALELAGGSLEHHVFYQFAAGGISGSILFMTLNYLINSKGGFLRKSSTTLNYMREKKAKQYKYLFEKLSKVDLFRQLPPEEVHDIIPFIVQKNYHNGDIIFHKGEPGDSLYIIDEGEVSIYDPSSDKEIAVLSENHVLGEMSLVTGEPRSATAIAKGDVRAWVILKEHFDHHLYSNPKIATAVNELVSSRISDLKDKKHIGMDQAEKWLSQASRNVHSIVFAPTETEIKQEHEAHSGAGIAIWLGNLLDCIPGGLIIGTSMASADSMPSLPLIAGLFLANYPEALGSSYEMVRQGTKFWNTVLMWGSLMLVTGLAAFGGNYFLSGIADEMHGLFGLLEGVAAGAMLTMIAETMLPEAYHKYSSITGFSTLMGFLVAILLKMYE
ncbi:MAG: cyclic nucleotide-binding domain-containing protein [Sphingobacteriales bacterium]|nr:cyclic nucleotide-binding domain-containing protein [Sphingobacteriales bacterium]